jgi:hypothetical protein
METRRKPDFDALRCEIRAYHDEFIAAHVENRPDFFVQDLAEDYVNVSRGELVRQTREEILDLFTEYLGHTTFSEYRMPEEPTIGFSGDGSVAWSIFRLQVAGVRTRPDETEAHFDDTWGCLMLFGRRDGRWVRIAEASNRKPDEA